jgi:hypothetical protein
MQIIRNSNYICKRVKNLTLLNVTSDYFQSDLFFFEGENYLSSKLMHFMFDVRKDS